jgi:hypothetical protein
MAKLSAHGTELVRLGKHNTVADGDVLERHSYISIRSDLAVMMRQTVKFAASTLTPTRLHDYGWKLKYRGSAMKAKGFDAEKIKNHYLSVGYTLEG